MVTLSEIKDRSNSRYRNKRVFVVINGKLVERVQGRTKVKYFDLNEGDTKRK
jgi:hypothetical protein